MSDVIVYDPLEPTVANRVTDYIRSANTPEYSGNPNTLINPTITAILAIKYWKYNGTDTVIDMSGAEVAAIDAADAAADLAEQQAEAVTRASLDIGTRSIFEGWLFEVNKLNTRMQEIQDSLTAVKNTSGGSDNIRAAIPGPSATTGPAPASFLNVNPKLRSQVLQKYVDDINAGTADP